ncbi:MAG: serine protease [Bdellovibrionota bacterium]|jgi:V8-like Glu-specific endopeptidase|nr:serine protease [Bdellovibrionota bacterium]
MKVKGIILSVAMACGLTAQANQKVIYGDDNRRDVYEVTNPLFLEMAKSTAALISKRNLSRSGEETKIFGRKLGDARGLCQDEPFRDQIASANCSGFLVAPNILVTAGHCIRSASACNSYNFVFGFETERQGQDEWSVPTENVYSCKNLIKTVLDNRTGNDYAVVELDRDVTGRRPMPFRKSGKVTNGQELVVIGHPSGLPTKIADGAFVRNNNNSLYFSASLDTYGGNSGSAVFNVNTGEIEGILVRGETDYVRNGSCVSSNICPMDGCRGEDVTRITNVSEIMNL